MQNPPTTYNFTTEQAISQTVNPILSQLQAIFDTIPEEILLRELKTYYAGRRGYTHRVLWRVYVAMTVLNLPSFSAMIRDLQNNPYVWFNY